MSSYQMLDEPVAGPQWDLLGMDVYAERLAEYIGDVEPPFTVGVYGQWGEGKTSFVNLLAERLRERDDKVTFVQFSAWPYATADDLWRALVLRIAQALYGPLPQEETPGFRERVQRALVRDALVLVPDKKKQPETPDPRLAAYKRLLRWADQASYTGISKGGDEQLQINQEVTLVAIARASLEALSTMSPIARALRGFFGGLERDVDLADLFQRKKSEAKQESITSIQKLREKEGEVLFDQLRGERRVYVFVDDLDRCLPNVALDVLEAIKNFLNVRFVFIVAADEELIGQGLRLRYKELVGRATREEMDDFISQKGREYFEKIIQFGVQVPPRTPEQAHHFVAAQFPQWQPATDIIQATIGTNPRRLKQYCNLLSYKRMVGQIPLSLSEREEATVTVIPTRIKISSGDGARPEPLAVSPGLYRDIINILEACVAVDNQDSLRELFLDTRIRQWREPVFEALDQVLERGSGARADYSAMLIETLLDRHNQQGENALLLFLQVLLEIPLYDDCPDRIQTLLRQLVGEEGPDADE